MTGANRGLGLAAARDLVRRGHEIVAHARSLGSMPSVGQIATIPADVSELADLQQLGSTTTGLGVQAIIHNAGLGFDRTQRALNSAGIEEVFAVNVLAPFVTIAATSASTHIVISSNAHHRGRPSLADVSWHERPWNPAQAYEDSKLFVTALTLGAARRLPRRTFYLVEPGWVPTAMGGPDAPDPIELAHVTQVALLEAGVPQAVSGGYYRHLAARNPSPAATDPAFQDAVLGLCTELTGMELGEAVQPIKPATTPS